MAALTTTPSHESQVPQNLYIGVATHILGALDPNILQMQGLAIGNTRMKVDNYGDALGSTPLTGDRWRTAHDAFAMQVYLDGEKLGLFIRREVYGIFLRFMSEAGQMAMKLIILLFVVFFAATDSNVLHEGVGAYSSAPKQNVLSPVLGGSLRYSGDRIDGVIHGKGKMIYFNGDQYYGDWEDNMHHGNGRMVFADGDVYEGQWKENHLSTSKATMAP
jgi:hypothetical protein